MARHSFRSSSDTHYRHPLLHRKAKKVRNREINKVWERGAQIVIKR